MLLVSIDGYEYVPAFDDDNALKKAVAHQPFSVTIEAGGMALQLYDSVSNFLTEHCHNHQIYRYFIYSNLNAHQELTLYTNSRVMSSNTLGQ